MQISEADASEEVQQSFIFNYVNNEILEEKKIKELFQKWGLNYLTVSSYRFNQRFEEVSAEQFLLEFFNFPEVRQTLSSMNSPKENYSTIKYKRLKVNQIKMDLFDRLEENNLVVKDMIKQTYEDFVEEIQINDLVRECLIKEESEHYEIFSEEDRKQFLFRLFQLVVLGGQMCQWEEKLSIYLDATKHLYKNLVTARKDSATDNIYIDSFVYEIQALDKSYKKGNNPQDVLYVVVNPSIRMLHVVQNAWVKVW
ncbi:hypothetical protein TTHERM_00586530 (macronuclear) [Tetrahymena thermophila SB210]|uniref:Cilia- and flagella-associated protein 300 n=1 Tax=Tetrahymena thermophila (strain SB210) TaxID=312017 RepID=I7M8T2_TETTS|nr:hypothetical protein TTHERM_00586530 [Tetrahymena thermophila SB210]EAR99613.2 hypothetical protein TTHERM_00586530 [Tetrahymena thermophila SB210]|eukprot:XP_001019858.2 hypothetical protein TTHERM_00586530 [Tetrahymena thermophila SB210]